MAEEQQKDQAAKQPEMKEIATTGDGRDITRGYVNPMAVAPPDDEVLQIRGAGDYQIYREVLRDDQVASCFGQRRLSVVSKEWDVEAGGDRPIDKEAADFLKQQLQNNRWDRVTNMMLYGVHYGFAVAEPLWGRDGNRIILAALKVRNRRRFGFDGQGRLRMMTMSNPMGELLPERKFWAFSTGADNDDEHYGLGLGHWLYLPAFFKRNGLSYWMIFLEKFGMPTAKGTYSEGGDVNKLLQTLMAIGTDSGVAVPEGMQIELIEAARSGTADYSGLYATMDRAIAKVILGQVASTEGTPGKLGNDDLQGDVRLDLIKADADLINESFNDTIARWLTEWNFPGAAIPRVYRKVEADEDLAKRAERDGKIKDMGFKPSVGYITETYGGEWVEDTPPKPDGPGADQPSDEPAASFAAVADDGTKTQAQRLVTDTQSTVDRWVGQIEKLVNEADSLEHLQEQLLVEFAALDEMEMIEVMGMAFSSAQLAGRAEVMEEDDA